ncbi:MAG: glycosyltransferase family 2 protein [Candidatus Limnocylindrales bacterium]
MTAAAEPERPLLSVLIPSWMSVGTIERCLDSILEERAVALECVVVDDASTDGTAERVAAYAVRDPRVRLTVLATNQGASAARNVGLEQARGEWLAFVDADDRLLPGGVAALMRPTSDPAVRAVVGQRIWTDGRRTWVSALYDIPDIRQPGRKSIVTHPGLLYYMSATGRAFHRSTFDGLRFEGRVLGDQPPTIRALLRAGDGIEVIADDVYEWWRPDPDQATGITASTRASASRSAASATIAQRAFREVADEVDVQIADEGDRRRVKLAYAERLIRSDFSAALRSALDRRDPETPILLEALGDLLAAMPAWILSPPDTVLRSILRPTWRHWRTLSPAGRQSLWRILDIVAAADPSATWQMIGSRRLAPALKLARQAAGRWPWLGNALIAGIQVTARGLRVIGIA